MTKKKLKPCDCKDSESIEQLNESGIGFNEDSITLDRNCVILKMSHTQVRIPASRFKMFAEWYLDEQEIEDNN